MKTSTKKTLKTIGIIIGLAIVLVLVGKYLSTLALIGNELTAYNSFSWMDDKLTYSSIFQANDLGMITNKLTKNHIYVKYYGTPTLEWSAVENNCQGADYPCVTEQAYNTIYPPNEIVRKYKTPDEFAKNYTCRVSGNIIQMFKEQWNERIDFKYPYSFEGTDISWEGNQRGFACKIANLTLTNLYNAWCSVLEPNNAPYSSNSNACFGYVFIISGNVEFTPKPECSGNDKLTQQCWDGSAIVTKQCNNGVYVNTGTLCPDKQCTNDLSEICYIDDSVIITKKCINGVYSPTGNVCPVSKDDNEVQENADKIPISFYVAIIGIILVIALVVFLKLKFK